MNATLRAWNDVKADQLSPGITWRYIHGEQAMVAQFELRSGAVVPWHEHASEQISLLLSGQARFEFGPADSAEAPGVLEDALAIDVFAPPREDWISGDDAYFRAVQEP